MFVQNFKLLFSFYCYQVFISIFLFFAFGNFSKFFCLFVDTKKNIENDFIWEFFFKYEFIKKISNTQIKIKEKNINEILKYLSIEDK